MAADARPNILLVFTDQQSATMMSCAGNRWLCTPAMDSLAATGIRFERAYCTNPVCIPSRFSLMTGLMPSAIGMLSNSVSHITTVSDSMKKGGLGWLMLEAGYDVAYAGKVHLPKMTAQDMGFEYICNDERDQLPEACSEFIGRKRKKPFFLVASLINPHDICYMAIRDSQSTESEMGLIERGKSEYRTLDRALTRPTAVSDKVFFAEYCPPLPENFEPQADEPEAIRLLLEQRPFRIKARCEWSDQRWREHRWAYARLTETVDTQISRVLEALRKSGQYDRTLIIFSSDHGDMDASHRMEHKSTLYEEVCRVPLILRLPGDACAGRVDDTHLVSNGLDFLPTICDYAGIEPPQGLMGQSLRPLVERREPVSWRDALPIESAIGRAIVSDRFKYVVYDMGLYEEQLIDLKEDPGETKDHLNDPRNRHMIEKLRSKFQETFSSERRHPADILKAAADA